MRLFYVLGYPGAGKTTAVEGMLAALGVVGEQRTDPVPHTRYGGVVHLGRPRAVFGGTDTLAMNIQPRVTEWITRETRNLIVVGEGDRLANAKFFDAVRSARVPLHLAVLDLSPTDAYERMIARAEANGMEPQNLSWFRGRVTKVDNLCGLFRCTYIDARQEPDAVARQLWAAAALPESLVSARVAPVAAPPGTSGRGAP